MIYFWFLSLWIIQLIRFELNHHEIEGLVIRMDLIFQDSILDIRMPMFKDGKLLSIQSYMDNFPFPFYLILRDINMLPSVLSDALRQWFEVVGKIET